jgi:protein N-terminal glutamine amidohydrolase
MTLLLCVCRKTIGISNHNQNKSVKRVMAPSEFRYCACYCEENIWHLCQDHRLKKDSNIVIFISNGSLQCAISNQKSGNDGFVIWDYHVVLLNKGDIWDFDTLLPFPCPAGEYLKKSFVSGISNEYDPMFRLVDAVTFVRSFSSDRSHMIDENGEYLKPPPTWPKIDPTNGSNLFRFVNMSQSFTGKIYTLFELQNALTKDIVL